MNRVGLKNASKQCLEDTRCNTVLVTLVYLLVVYGIGLLYTMFTRTAMPEIYIDFYRPLPTVIVVPVRSMVQVSIGGVLLSLLSSVWSVGYCNSLTLHLSRGEECGMGNLLDGFVYCGKVIWLSILIMVFTALWFCLLVIPGIVASYRYSMAFFVLYNNPDLTAREALNESKRITYGHKGELFLLTLSFIPWHLLCMLTFGILYLWKLPYISTTYAHAYNWLVSLQEPRQTAETWYTAEE